MLQVEMCSLRKENLFSWMVFCSWRQKGALCVNKGFFTTCYVHFGEAHVIGDKNRKKSLNLYPDSGVTTEENHATFLRATKAAGSCESQ